MNNNLQIHNQRANFTLVVGQPATPLEVTIEAFLRSLPGKNRSAATVKAYRSDLGQFATWLTENNVIAVDPTRIRRADVEAYLSDLAHLGLSGVSRSRKLAAIREYFRFLEDHGTIARSPAAGVDGPRREQKTRSYLKPDEYRAVLSLAGSNARDYAILQVFLQTGLRVSELVHLRMVDLDLAGKVLTVRGGKGLSDREIDLEKHAIEAVKNWLRIRPPSLHEHLFLNYRGEPISERSVRRLVAKYRHRAGLTKKATPHTLRHTFASYKARRGVPLRQVQEWLGHKNIATTQIYVHLDRQDAQKAMEATSL
ncbi:MAG: tyrosine-type recombinase/integrase [Dehalococcoidia bacterium]